MFQAYEAGKQRERHAPEPGSLFTLTWGESGLNALLARVVGQKYPGAKDAPEVTLSWVQGHAGDAENELCDRLAVEAAQAGAAVDEGYERPVEVLAALGPATLFDGVEMPADG